MAQQPKELAPEQLRRVCTLDHFDFEKTSDIQFEQTIIGQPRGIRAIEFGINIDVPGFNIYVLGPTGTGRTTAIRQFLEQCAKDGEVPLDWVYVNNFEVEHQPRAIELPPGEGGKFRDDMTRLIETLRREIPLALEAEEYTNALEKLGDEADAKRNEIFQTLTDEAREKNFAIVRTPSGLMIAPLGEDGQVMPPEEFSQLEEEVRNNLNEQRLELEDRLEEGLRRVRDIDRESREAADKLEREAAAFVVDQHIGDMKEAHADHDEVLLYLGQVREDVLEHLSDFTGNEEEDEEPGPVVGPLARQRADEVFRRYSVNLIVDHSKTQGSPVILEELPSYANLVGRVEGEVQMGALRVDFTMIKPGALHRANGGYLVLRVQDLLSQPGAWEGLKRALQSGEIRVEEMSARTGVGVLTPQTIDPEPIPLKIKVILLGSSSLYYLLYGLEEDFSDLFKVKADFAATMDRTQEAEDEYAEFVAARCQESGLPCFDKAAVGQIVEYGSRLAGDQNKLSTLFGHLADMIHEAAYWARAEGRDGVNAGDVIRAIEERRYRANLYEERTFESIQRGRVFIDTEGEIVGQVNGLSVMGLGDYMFGQPNRITARVYVGKEGLVNIEREVAMSGPIHDKGVLTLRGYLGGHYALDHPLALTASLTFEQNYSGIEGDSASSAELYALLSALSGHTVKQSLAVTGSVNQRGQVQPIGGVTEKIEGFFQVCKERGLTGDQGVLIPTTNVDNLMLRTEVIDAVREGQFHVYAVESIDQGIELLTGVPAGERQPDGTYPEGTVHDAVQRRLHELAERVREFEKP